VVIAPRRDWVLLAYRLPREPSTPRITLWRKLRKLGAVQVVDGLVALPASPRTREQFDWLAEEVIESGGEAWTWLAQSVSVLQDEALEAQFTEAAVEDYRSLLGELAALTADAVTPRTFGRLRRELHRIESRDHVGPPEREQARRAIEALATAVTDAVEEATR